ncbi:arylformamidase [Nocardioides albus]|uniref:Kynurenine formamidase n=1 Tax=Nocardioides albus TaxID=1841 RepID=A0A7W5F9I6_9ACTN|nr:arylformamidase [Nocardioides albus]MBB3090339.1 arylformamidase [Nocardioides albus]GGU29417.1 kynurenine formamidase [Nocardioides albus]
MAQLWDISPPVHADSPVFPGDHATEVGWTFRIGPGCPVNVAELSLSAHVGAHADAPLHFTDDGAPAGEMSLEPFLGPCRVVDVSGVRPLVTVDDVDVTDLPPRVLFRTYATQPTTWDDDFCALDPPLIDLLASHGVRLVGTDAASLDPADSKDLPAHFATHRHDVRILENLLLDEVPAGDYELIALPLKLTTADAAPVRAVLRPLTQESSR